MSQKILVPSLLALLLIACGGGDDDTDTVREGTVTETQETDTGITVGPASGAIPPEVDITQMLGTFEGDVTGLAVWRDPVTVFESMVLAANGEAGLFAVPIGETPATDAPGTFQSIAVGYGPGGALLAAAERDSLRLFAMGPGGPAPLTSRRLSGVIRDLCFVDGAATDTARQLIAIVEGGPLLVRVGGGEGGMSIGVEELDAPALRACAGQADALLVVGAGGDVSKGRLVPSADGSAPTLVLSDFAYQPTGALADIAVMPTTGGPVAIYVLGDGGVQVNGRLIDVEGFKGMAEPTHVAAGGGNFGTVYRGGLMALVSDDSQLGIVPWLAVMNALGLEAPSVSAVETAPRGRTPAGDAPPAAEIDVPELGGLEQDD